MIDIKAARVAKSAWGHVGALAGREGAMHHEAEQFGQAPDNPHIIPERIALAKILNATTLPCRDKHGKFSSGYSCTTATSDGISTDPMSILVQHLRDHVARIMMFLHCWRQIYVLILPMVPVGVLVVCQGTLLIAIARTARLLIARHDENGNGGCSEFLSLVDLFSFSTDDP